MRRIVLLLASGALAVLLSAGAALAVAPGAVLDAHTTSYDYAGMGCGGQPNLRQVQTFEAQNTGLLSDAQARIYGFPETTGYVTAEIVTIPTPDNPSQVLGEASIPASSVGVGVFVGDDVENSPMVNFSFAEGVPVTAGQSYGLRISNNVCWIMADYTTAQDLDAYPDGKWVVDPGNGSPWIVSSSTRDGVFAIYVRDPPAPTYNFTGFFSPVDNPDVATNRVKAGSAVPVKFSLGGDMGLDVFAEAADGSDYPKSGAMACDSTDPVDAIEQTVSAGSSGLTYDTDTERYTYVWKTQKAWTGCRQLVVKFDDRTVHRANFKLVK